MKKKTPYLDFYKASESIGIIQRGGKKRYNSGLCGSQIGHRVIFRSIFSSDESIPGWANKGYWANESESVPDFHKSYGFNYLRQNIVLLCAALNNEL